MTVENYRLRERLENVFTAIFDNGLSLDQLYKKTLDLFQESFGVSKCGISIHDPINSLYRIACYNGLSQKDLNVTKVTISENGIDEFFVESLKKGNPFVVNFLDEKIKDVRFYKSYSTITNSKYSYIFPIIYGGEILGAINLDFTDDESLKDFNFYSEDAGFLARLFTVSLKNSLLFQNYKSRYEEYKDLHTSSLTLNKLYLNNTQEIIRMSLLTVSGLLDTDINLLLILTPKFQLLTIYRLLKSISGLDLDHFTEELTDYEQYSFLLEKEEPAVYNSKEIPFIRKFGFTGSELLVLPSFELQGNKYAFMMARNTTRLFAPEEIELLNSFAELAKITIDNSFMFHQKANQERLEKEIEIAKDIQSNLLPRSMPISEEFDFGGFMIPAREIGGDYYDFLQSPDKKETIVAIGDVSGKGLPAGMVMATARTIIHSFVRRNPSLAEITRELNSYLYSNYINSVILRFMSMTILSIDHTQNKVEYIGAGHGNLLVYRHATKEVELIETGGTILGIIQDLPEEMYKMRPKLTINSNDIILLYTDGATETTNAAGEQFEESGMIELLKKYSEKSSKDLLIAIYEDLKKFAGSAPQHDDITLVSIKKL